MEEEWKSVSEYPDRFMVSNHGRVWSKKSNKILVQGTNSCGYRVISSKIGGRNGTYICRRVHRWVAEAFIDNPDNKPFVNHIDGDKTNNFEWNLEWCTGNENMQHAFDAGLQTSLQGEQTYNAKLTETDVRYIRHHHKNRCNEYGTRALAKKFNVNHATISGIINNKTWKHLV